MSLATLLSGTLRYILSCNSSMLMPPAMSVWASSSVILTFIMLQTGMLSRSSILLPSSLRTSRLIGTVLSPSFNTPTGWPSVAASSAWATSLRVMPALKAFCGRKSTVRFLLLGFQLFCTE